MHRGSCRSCVLAPTDLHSCPTAVVANTSEIPVILKSGKIYKLGCATYAVVMETPHSVIRRDGLS